jgi:hypothetical protein
MFRRKIRPGYLVIDDAGYCGVVKSVTKDAFTGDRYVSYRDLNNDMDYSVHVSDVKIYRPCRVKAER